MAARRRSQDAAVKKKRGPGRVRKWLRRSAVTRRRRVRSWWTQAGALAQNLAYKSPFALHLTKEALNAGLNASCMDEALMMENRNQSYMLTMQLMKYLEQQR